MSDLLSRITVEPEKMGGKPCIRGLRIRVSDVLDLLAEGLSNQQVIEELPSLEEDDIRAVFAYASRRLNHTIVAG